MTVTTRAQYETILLKRLGALLTAAGLDGTNHSGANADLNDPLGYAVRKLGGTVVNLVSVDDTDLATVAASKLDALLDVAQLRTMENVSGNYVLVDNKTGPYSQNLSQVKTALQADIDKLRTKIETEYGIGLASMEITPLKIVYPDEQEIRFLNGD